MTGDTADRGPKTTEDNGRFKAGNPGRPKGTPNKVNQEFRETVRLLLESNAENVGIWLDQVATGAHDGKPDPGRALDLLARLAEYAAPKLGRVEVQQSGDVGLTVKLVSFVDAGNHDT